MEPDVIVAGMMKTGTTSLYGWLAPHPRAAFCKLKEPHYFSEEWDRGAGWYQSLFEHAAPGDVRIEASQSYSHPDHAPTAARRIRETLPDARLVFVLREPLARARSEYRHQVIMGRETRPFLTALDDPRCPYLRRSMYRRCLDPYLRDFPRENLLFLDFERLVSPEPDEWHRFLDWVGLERIDRVAVPKGTTTKPRSVARPITRLISSVGGGTVARLVPRKIKQLARPLLYTPASRQERLFATAQSPLPVGLRKQLEDDAQLMADWLGRDLPWVSANTGARSLRAAGDS